MSSSLTINTFHLAHFTPVILGCLLFLGIVSKILPQTLHSCYFLHFQCITWTIHSLICLSTLLPSMATQQNRKNKRKENKKNTYTFPIPLTLLSSPALTVLISIWHNIHILVYFSDCPICHRLPGEQIFNMLLVFYLLMYPSMRKLPGT